MLFVSRSGAPTHFLRKALAQPFVVMGPSVGDDYIKVEVNIDFRYIEELHDIMNRSTEEDALIWERGKGNPGYSTNNRGMA